MLRRLTVIFILAAGLAALLIIRPWKANTVPPPRFFDRLPAADIIGKSNILDVSRAMSSTMYHFKIPLREFISHDFLLSQGKTYGIDVQKPIFFFLDQEEFEMKDFGLMAIVTDSSKIRPGLEQLIQVMNIKDTLIFDKTVLMNKEYNFYLTYGPDWLLIYEGGQFKKRLAGVLQAKRNEIPPKWRKFLNSTAYKNENAVAYLAFDELKEYGINSANIRLANDSTSLTLHTALETSDTLKFDLKQHGFSYESQEFTKYLINAHINPEGLYDDNDPFIKLANKYAQRINFPTEALLKAWSGDISYRQGGIQEIEEKYISSEMDENFNITEVVKTKKIKVPAYSLYLSINEYGNEFLDQLYTKGILTKDGQKHRVLYSPPMNMHLTDSSLILHTGKYLPAMYSDSTNHVMWTANKTAFHFHLDSTKATSVYGKIHIPLQRLIEDNIPNYGRK